MGGETIQEISDRSWLFKYLYLATTGCLGSKETMISRGGMVVTMIMASSSKEVMAVNNSSRPLYSKHGLCDIHPGSRLCPRHARSFQPRGACHHCLQCTHCPHLGDYHHLGDHNCDVHQYYPCQMGLPGLLNVQICGNDLVLVDGPDLWDGVLCKPRLLCCSPCPLSLQDTAPQG